MFGKDKEEDVKEKQIDFDIESLKEKAVGDGKEMTVEMQNARIELSRLGEWPLK